MAESKALEQLEQIALPRERERTMLLHYREQTGGCSALPKLH